MLTVRSSIFFIGMVISAPLVALLGLLTTPLHFSTRYRVLSQWAVFVIWWLKVTCNLTYRVTGMEHLRQTETAIIFIKHQSVWETLAFQIIFPPQVWVLKQSLLLIPIFGWGLALLKPVAIDRSAGRKALNQIVEQGSARLKDGIWVVVFPEGTRVAPKTTKRFGAGGAVLASSTKFPVIPVAHNAGSFWKRRGFLKSPGTIQLHIGAPIESDGKSASEINKIAEEWINEKMQELES